MKRRSFLWCAVAVAAAPFMNPPKVRTLVSYEVGPGKEHATVQDALDHLWRDHASRAFTGKVTVE